MRLLASWKVRVDGHIICRLTVADTMELAAALHRRLGLLDGQQIRLMVNQETFEPTGVGWVCRPDGSGVQRFQVIPAGPVKAAA